MSKGKYKRKRERTKERAGQEAEQIRLANNKVVSAEDQTDSSKTTHSDRHEKEGKYMGSREVPKKGEAANWFLVAFTGALTGVAIFQWYVTNKQLEVMRNDERAWVKLEVDKVNMTIGQPLSGPFHVVNVGKTPAKDINVRVFVDIIEASEAPQVEQVEDLRVNAHAMVKTGIIFPSDGFRQDVTRHGTDGSPIQVSNDEGQLLQSGKAYSAVYGMVTYEDVFNRPHWTKVCSFGGGVTGTFHAGACARYNGVDGN